MSSFTFQATASPVAPWQETVDLTMPLGLVNIRGFGAVQSYACTGGTYLLLRIEGGVITDLVHSTSTTISDAAAWIASTLSPAGVSQGGVGLPLYLLTDYLAQAGATSAGAAAMLMAGDDVFRGTAGNETFLGGGGFNSVDYAAATSPVQADLAAGSATGQGQDVLRDIQGLVGSAFDDLLSGSAAANLLAGGAGADTITGLAGNDTLLGGLGGDRLAGGAGLDVFRYGAAAEGMDTVIGYLGTEDQFEISAAGFGGGLVAGMDLAATGHYVANKTGAAKGTAAQFIFDTTHKTLWWDHDGRGGDAAVLVADLADAKGWSGSELTVIA